MFHLLRLNTAFSLMLSLTFAWVSELTCVREDREANVAFSILQQYWHLTTAMFFLCESFATFRYWLVSFNAMFNASYG